MEIILLGTIKMRKEMIKTVKELQEYVLKDSDRFEDPLFKRTFMMTSPGCSNEDIKALKTALSGIPDSYTKWVEAVSLNGVSVGYFEVCPTSFNPEGMVANLMEGNEEGVMFWEYMRQYSLYSVATIDGYGVFVATSSSPYKEGEIILIDEGIYAKKDNPEQWITSLAKDFEEFLIVAGNLNQIQREIDKDNANYQEKKKEFLGCLRKLGVSEEYHEAWTSMLY